MLPKILFYILCIIAAQHVSANSADQRRARPLSIEELRYEWTRPPVYAGGNQESKTYRCIFTDAFHKKFSGVGITEQNAYHEAQTSCYDNSDYPKSCHFYVCYKE